MRTLIVMENEKASFAMRAYCADKVIDRAFGKPVVGQVRRTARDLTDAELLEVIERSRQPKLIEAQAVEVAPSVEPQPVAKDVGEIVGTISETPE